MSEPNPHTPDSDCRSDKKAEVFFDLSALPEASAALKSLQKERRRWVIAAGNIGVVGLVVFNRWIGLSFWWGIASILVAYRAIKWAEITASAWQPKPGVLADVIERFDTSLAGRLKAAVEQAGQEGRFNYMQERLFCEVAVFAKQGAWQRCVPKWRQVAASFASGFGRMAAFVSILFSLLAPPANVKSGSGDESVSLASKELQVAPGDTEIEKGTRLTVSARFGEMTPGVALSFKESTGETGKISMHEGVGEPLYGASIEAVETDLEYWVESSGSKSPRYKARVFAFPKLVDATATVRYPEGMEPRERTFEDARKLSVPEGSDVFWVLKFNKPLKAARFRGKDNNVQELGFGAARNEAPWKLADIHASLDLKLELEDAEGRFAREQTSFRVEVTPNQIPKIRALLPRNDARFTAIEELDFEAEVWDDTGLKRWGVTLQFGKEEPREFVLGTGAKGGQKVKMRLHEPLEGRKLEVGDSLSWFFWAEDVFGKAGVRKVEGDLMLGRIRAFEEEYRQSDSDGEPGKGGPQLLEIQKQVIAASWNLRRKNAGPEKPEGEFKKGLETVRVSELKVQEMAGDAAGKEEDPLRQAHYTEALAHLEKAVAELSKASETKQSLDTAISEERSAYDALTHVAPSSFNMVRSKKAAPEDAQERTRQMSNLEFAKQEDRYQNKSEAKSEKENKERTEMEELLAQLRALARRQEEIAERMRELEARVNSSADKNEKEAAQRELKRLSDEQKALARELEDAQQKAAQKNETLSAQREQLDAAREAAQRAAAAMERGSMDEARAASARVTEKLREGSEALRQQLSGKTREAARNLQEQAQELQNEEMKVSEALNAPSKGPSKLVAEDVRKQAAGQQQRLKDLQEEIQRVSEATESSEPIFSKALQDAHRSTLQNQTDAKMKVVRNALAVGQPEVARRAEKSVSSDLAELEKALESASNEVLGDDAQALRQARAALDGIALALNQRKGDSDSASLGQARTSKEDVDAGSGKKPVPKAGEGGQREAGGGEGEKGEVGKGGKPGETAKAGEGGQREAGGGVGKKGEAGKGGKPGETAKVGEGGQREAGSGAGEKGEAGKGGKPGETAKGPRGDGREPADGPSAADGSIYGGGNGVPAQEIGQLLEKLDRVEALLEKPQLRAGVARVQQVAEEIWSDMKRQANKPSRNEVEQKLLAPLAQLRDAITSELARREGKESDVPVDRDPVPRKYEESVRRYYEALGGGR